MKTALQIEDSIHGIFFHVGHSLVPISKATQIPLVKITREGGLEDISLQKDE